MIEKQFHPSTNSYIIHAPMKKSLAVELLFLLLCSALLTSSVPVGYGQTIGDKPAAFAPARDNALTGVLFDIVSAQTPAVQCPQLVIACPLYIVPQDTQLRFSALVAGQDTGTALTYTWSLSSGTVSAGQGTPSITVDTTGLGGRRITATVSVSGLAARCQNMASCAIYVARPKDARLLDTYGDLDFNLEKTRLLNLVTELRNAPESEGYIIVYGGRCSAETEALERAERAKDWLINEHGIEASHIVTIDGGYRESPATEIFIGPVDATLPELNASTGPLDKSRCK
ncbi:MAG TPA: hypothetical protein VF735_17090 [Pyrinomonadaceae bacterium]